MLTTRPARPMRRRISGLTLIESLIAMVILSLGVAGLAWTQARLIVDGRQTSARGTALLLIADLSDRMMFNPATAASGGYALAWDETPGRRDCSAGCSGPELAQSDLGAWRSELSRALPMGNASVFRASDDPRHIGIAVSWPERNGPMADRDAPNGLGTQRSQAVRCPLHQQCHVAYVQP